MSRQKGSQYRLSNLLKSVRKDNLHPEVGGKRAAVRVTLDRVQMAGLKNLAKTYGTTVGTEFSNAVDAYLLDLSRNEIRLLVRFADLTKASASKINHNLSETLRETDKRIARIARMEHRGVKAHRKKKVGR